jgi:hypothetical protein
MSDTAANFLGELMEKVQYFPAAGEWEEFVYDLEELLIKAWDDGYQKSLLQAHGILGPNKNPYWNSNHERV